MTSCVLEHAHNAKLSIVVRFEYVLDKAELK